MTKYNKQYFIDKFKAIPVNNWWVGGYINPDNPKQKCALGHCNYCERMSLGELIYCVASINDGRLEDYFKLGKTPKQRILTALKQVK